MRTNKNVLIYIKKILQYSVIGFIFGIFDWYFSESLISSFPDYNLFFLLIGLIIKWGIWLVPAIPIAIHEVKRTHRSITSMIAVVVVWLTAIITYYLYYLFQIAFIGLPQLEYLLVFGQRSDLFWADWPGILQMLIIAQVKEWGSVAVVGGAIVGWATGSIYMHWQHPISHPTHK